MVLVTVSDITQPLGEAVSTLSVANSLASDFGFKTIVIAPKMNGAAPIFQPDNVTIKWTFNIGRLGLPNSLNVFPQIIPLVGLLMQRQLTHAYIRYNPCALLLAFISKIFGRGCLIVEHNAWLEDERRGGDRFPFLARLERLLQGTTARLASVNRTVIQDNADKLIANGVRKEAVIVAPNATNTHLIKPVSRKDALPAFGFDDSNRYIGFLGTFAYWQDIPILVEAMPKILEKMGNVRLILAGHGPKKSMAEIKARQLGIEDKVIFLGSVPYLDIPELLGCLDIALLPTRPDFYVTAGRSPMKLYDYAATGKAILAAEIEGIEGHAKDGWLVTYTPGNAKDLAEKALALLQDPQGRARLENAARNIAESHFSWRQRLEPIVDFTRENNKN